MILVRPFLTTCIESLSLNNSPAVRLTLHVHYTDDYPDSLPELSIPSYEGDLDSKEKADLLSQLHAVVSF